MRSLINRIVLSLLTLLALGCVRDDVRPVQSIKISEFKSKVGNTMACPEDWDVIDSGHNWVFATRFAHSQKKFMGAGGSPIKTSGQS